MQKNSWKKGKKADALRYLGYGLHAIQDIEAHGNIGKGKTIPSHLSKTGNVNKADDISYVWTNSSRNKLKKDSADKTKLVATRSKTYEYLNKFVKYVGGKSKV